MTLPVSGAISLGDVNTEIGAPGTSRSLGWVQSNSAFADKDLNSLHGQKYFAAVSSTGSITRSSRTSTVTNCSPPYSAVQHNSGGFDGTTGAGLTNCSNWYNVNCNQCTYAHGGNLLQGQCNCNCNCWVCNCDYTNCNCACNCGGDCSGCFVAGDRVLMADGEWRAVELLNDGDWLMGANWRPVRLKFVKRQTITPNVLISIGSLIVTGDHAMWVKDDAGEGFWVFDKDLWLQVVAEEAIGGLKDNDTIRTSAEGVPVTFAHVEGWKTIVPRVIERGVERETFSLRTEGSIPIIVEGFVPTSETNERDFEATFGHDYSGFKWGVTCH